MKGRKNQSEDQITDQDIEKALEALGLGGVEEDGISKSEEDEFANDEEYLEAVNLSKGYLTKGFSESKIETLLDRKGYDEDTIADSIEKAKKDMDMDDDDDMMDKKKAGMHKKGMKKNMMKKEMDMDDDDDMDDDMEYKKGKYKKGMGKKGMKKDYGGRTAGDQAAFMKKGFEAMATLSRGVMQRLDKIEKAQSENVEDIYEAFEELEKAITQPQRRKSSTTASVRERQFAKGNESDLQKGGEVNDGKTHINIKNRAQMTKLLEHCAFEKGYDQEYANALMTYESDKVVPQKVLNKLEIEKGIVIDQL